MNNGTKQINMPISNNNQSVALETYLEYRLSLEMILVTPIIMYGIFLIFLIHISRHSKINIRKVNKRMLKISKVLTTIMSIYFVYQFLSFIFLGYNLPSGDLFLFLFLQSLETFISLLTFFVNYELTQKMVSCHYQKSFLLFWLVISIKIFIELTFEIYYGLVFNLLTFSSVGLICSAALSYIHYKYPKIDLYPSGNEVYYELQYLPLLSTVPFKVSDGKETLPDEFKNRRINRFKNKKTNPISKAVSQKKLDVSFNSDKSKSPSFNLKEKYFSDNNSLNERVSIDQISKHTPEMLPYYPKIEIIFKDNYKYYQDKNIFSNENSNDNISKYDFINNFFFHMVIKITDKNFNISVKRSIQDFLGLERDLKTEFSHGKYIKKLSDRLPKLKIPKIYIFTDFFKKYKVNFEIFMNSIVNEPCYITDEVLNFLEIHDDQLSFSYNLMRKKNLNASRITDDTFAFKNSSIDITKFLEKEENDGLYGLRPELSKPYPGRSPRKLMASNNMNSTNNLNNLSINSPTNTQKLTIGKKEVVKLTILDIKQDIHTSSSEYTVMIRISQNFMFRILNKKLSEVLKMITELSQINKNNENIKTLLKSLKAGDFSENLFNINNIRKTYSLLENVLQNSYDNFKMYRTNLIISEFFQEFFDESRANSRCESFVNYGKSVIVSKEKDIKKKKKKIEYYRKLVNDDQIVSVQADVVNFIFLMIDFKPHVFYVVNFKSTLVNGSMEEVSKKLKYREINEFIDLMSIRLNIIGKIMKDTKVYKNLDTKIQIRKSELQSNLATIFNSINLVRDKEWIQILERDRKYRLMKNAKSQQNQLVNKPSFILLDRTESRESIFNLNIRDSIL